MIKGVRTCISCSHQGLFVCSTFPKPHKNQKAGRISKPILTYEETQWTGRESHLPKVTELTQDSNSEPTMLYSQWKGRRRKEARKRSFQDILGTSLRNVGDVVRSDTRQSRQNKGCHCGCISDKKRGNRLSHRSLSQNSSSRASGGRSFDKTQRLSCHLRTDVSRVSHAWK